MLLKSDCASLWHLWVKRIQHHTTIFLICNKIKCGGAWKWMYELICETNVPWQVQRGWWVNTEPFCVVLLASYFPLYGKLEKLWLRAGRSLVVRIARINWHQAQCLFMKDNPPLNSHILSLLPKQKYNLRSLSSDQGTRDFHTFQF